MNFVEMLTERDALTENGAVTNSTSHSSCLDLFFLAGACRNVSDEELEIVISKAYNEDRLKTLKIIFWAGDIRQGVGERRFFKVALNYLNKNHKEDIQNNISLIPEFSRWDVLFDLANENKIVFAYLVSVLSQKEHPQYNLLCKWLPRKPYAIDKKSKVSEDGKTKTITKTKRVLYNGLATKLARALNLNMKQYRKLSVEGSNTVEQKMCSKQWSEINYSQVPSVAMNKYTQAWNRNDGERFNKYLEDVKSGKTKINASVIFPHDIIKSAMGYYKVGQLSEAQIVQWNNLPNYLNDTLNYIIPVCDVSGSMHGLPLEISLALGLYISERNVGPFKDAFITFSGNPKLEYLKGNLNERLKQLASSDWGNNTNLLAVFELILKRAMSVNLDPSLMPKSVLIISDMEFDAANGGYNYYDNAEELNTSIYDHIKRQYAQAGYNCPNIIFWNVNGRPGNVPITTNDLGAALISGASPSVIKSVLGESLSAIDIMNKNIETERYSVIK